VLILVSKPSEQRWNRVYVPSKHEKLTLAMATPGMEAKPAVYACVSVERKSAAKNYAKTTVPSRFPWAEIQSQTVREGDPHC
jgi:hypothetical protein